MHSAHRTEIGHRRDRNEDALLVAPDRGLFVVADGMGGHPAGDVASRIAVEVLDAELATPPGPDPKPLAAGLEAAHRAILSAAHEDRSRAGMGTTAVAATITSDPLRLALAHVGDSRAYLASDSLRRLTTDHTQGGLFGRTLTQALGVPDAIEPESVRVDLTAGDRVLLCTDGLTDLVDDDDLATLLADASSVEEACDRLVDAALEAGGHDNVTVVVVEA